MLFVQCTLWTIQNQIVYSNPNLNNHPNQFNAHDSWSLLYLVQRDFATVSG